MTDVAEHDPEEERKDWDGEESRIDFFVSRNTIGVDDLLKGCGEGVHLEVGGRFLMGLWLSDGDL